MKTRQLLALGACILLWSSTVFGQRIRSYGDAAEAQYGTQPPVNYPGAPVPQPQVAAPAPQGQAEAPKGEAGAAGEKEAIYSNVTTMYGGPSPNNTPLPKDLKPEELYRGVIPGTRDSIKQFERAAQKGQTGANELLWIGFQPREKTTRVFIQTAREATYDVSINDAGAVVLTFKDTKLAARNFSRFIDTRYFERNVTRIESKRHGKDVVITISLKKPERPQINATETYVYVEFSAAKVNEETTDGASNSSGEDSE